MVVWVRRRPAVVDVSGFACLVFSNVSHEIHSDRSRTPTVHKAARAEFTCELSVAPASARSHWGLPAALRWSAMTDNTADIPLGSWLADMPDERLIRLLELRPDLAQPPPGSIAALAARAQARQSVKAATDELDFLRLAVIDALLVLHADTAPVPVAKLLTLIGDRAPEPEVLDALDDLKERALVWGDTELRAAPDAGAGLPWHPGQVTLEDASQSAEQIAELIDGLDGAQREVLDKLLEGSPLG